MINSEQFHKLFHSIIENDINYSNKEKIQQEKTIGKKKNIKDHEPIYNILKIKYRKRLIKYMHMYQCDFYSCLWATS